MHRMKWGEVLIRVVISLLSCSCGHEVREGRERGSFLIRGADKGVTDFRRARAGGALWGSPGVRGDS